MNNEFSKDMYIGQLGDGNFLFGSVDIEDDGRFSMSFTEVEAVDEDKAYALAVDYIDGFDDSLKLSILQQYDVPPSELADTVIECDGIEGVLDCSSCDPSIDGYYFLFVSAGQHDYREYKEYNGGLESPANVEATDFLMGIWDEYHLKEIPDELAEKVVAACENLPEKNSDETKNLISELLGIEPEISR